MPQLLPCSSCSRHVLVSETQCPFCGSSLKLQASGRPRVPQGLRRAQLFALGATLATAACSDSVPVHGATATPEDFGPGTTSTDSSAGPGASEEQNSTAATETDATTSGGTVASTGGETHPDAGLPDVDASAGDAGSAGTETTGDGTSVDDWTVPGAQPVYGAVPVDRKR